MFIQANKFGKLRNYLISVECDAGSKVFSLLNQTYLNDKNIIAIQVSGEAKNFNNQNLTNEGFYLILYSGSTVVMNLPAKTTLDFKNLNMIMINRNDIDWQKSQILFPADLGANAYVDLVVWFEDN
jgi:hypothetical protein